MTFREVILSVEGLYEQNKYYHDILQLATRLICLSGFNAKSALGQMSRAWPVENKNRKLVISQRAKDQLFELRKVEAIKSAKQKIDAGRS